ncbi:MAG: hypothetical protein HY862_21610 [Chloroflexi bacterium]|nr:hypothetical protein [Chloroflexota bacterium]
MPSKTRDDLAQALLKSQNAALVVGAGISYDLKIPLGYRLPMEFGAAHQSLLAKVGLLSAWQAAQSATDPDTRWNLEKIFVDVLVSKFAGSIELQQVLVGWLGQVESMAGVQSDTHAAFAVTWLQRKFKHLITTNWDFLLEWQIDGIYYEAYNDPFAPANYSFASGANCTIQAEHLFFLESLEGEDYFWHPRWDIAANVSDLPNLRRWSRPLWKIHGSPVFLACPKCGGFSHWKFEAELKVNDPCPVHPDERLLPEIVFWGQGLDTAQPEVWQRVKKRLQRSDCIIASGFSGSGSDVYIRRVIEANSNAWVVNPSKGAWDVDKVHFVETTAADLAQLLIERVITI